MGGRAPDRPPAAAAAVRPQMRNSELLHLRVARGASGQPRGARLPRDDEGPENAIA